MKAKTSSKAAPRPLRTLPVLVLMSVLVSGLLLWGSYGFFTQRFTESLRSESQTRASLYAGNIKSTLQKHSVVPFLLTQDRALATALTSFDYTNTSQRLIEVADEIGAASVFLLNISGSVVASSDRRQIGKYLRTEPYFIDALRNANTVFTASATEQNDYRFFFSQKIRSGPKSIGVVVVEVDLGAQETLWKKLGLLVALVNSQGEVQLSSVAKWRRQSIDTLIDNPAHSASRRILDAIQQTPYIDFIFLDGQRLFASEYPVGFRGWRINFFASTQNVSARVNAILALEIMAMAIVAALTFFYLSRRRALESQRLSVEGDELRALNTRLSAEVEQRQRAERNLQSAEQNLEQASKLAALGQMSAEGRQGLNQPLAAGRN